MCDWQALVRRNLGPLRTSPEREAAIISELAAQLEQTFQNAQARGLGVEASIAEAEAQFPDWKHLAREINAAASKPAPEPSSGGAWTGFLRDLRFAARQLARALSFTIITAATLCFAIGGCTAVFSVADALTLRGLPYKDPSKLVSIEMRKSGQPEIEPWTSALDFFDLRDRTRTLSSMAAISPIWNMVLTGKGPAQRLECLFVSANFFPALGVDAERGRIFRADEDKRNAAAPVVVISHALWRDRLGGDPTAVGKAITLDGSAFTVVGIMPADFRYLGEPVSGTQSDIDVWLPLSANPMITTMRGVRFLKTIGRLAPGSTLVNAQAELSQLNAELTAQFPATNRGFDITAASLPERIAGRSRLTMILLAATAGFILVMSCANVSSLVLARAMAREREIAARVALGATPWRLVRLLLAESLAIATLGGATGIAAAWLGVRAFIAAAPAAMLHQYAPAIDKRALIVTLILAIFCAVVAALPPALRLAKLDVEPVLRAAGRGLTGSRGRLQGALVIAQVASALILLTGAGLLLRSFIRLLEVDPGFDERNVVTISTMVPASGTAPAQRAAAYEHMRTQLENVPGVAAVGAVSRLPLMGRNLGSWIFVEGRSRLGDPQVDIEYRVATASYFNVMRIPLREGRMFEPADDATPAQSVLINQTAARRFWPGESAVGRRIKLGPNPERQPWINIIGVVGDVHHGGLDIDVLPEVYRPYALNPLNNPILVIRTGMDPASLIQTLTSRVQAVSPDVPAYDVSLMRDLIARSTAQRRFVMGILAGFAISALILAGVGIFGIMSRLVVRRTPELGVRMALGATPDVAAQLIAGQGARLALCGILIGLAGAAIMTHFIRTLLFEVRPLDPAAFVAAVAVLLLSIGLACFVPVWRATRLDPLVALRRED
jgi:predicted permease